MKYVLYIKHDGDWLFWQHNFGWADIGSATVYDSYGVAITTEVKYTDSQLIEGKILPVGLAGELAPLAPAILDIDERLQQLYGTTSIQGYDRQELASQLASSLRQADPLHLDLEAIYENGYCFRVTDKIDDNET